MFQINFLKWKNEVNARLDKLETDNLHSSEAFTGLISRLDNYEDRIVALEEARKKQIILNQQLLDQKQDKPVMKPEPKVEQPASVELSPVARNILHGLIKSIFKRYEPGKQVSIRKKK